MHSNSILHRDLKTLNIFLTKDNRVRIGDLGVAKILDNFENFVTSKVGTPYYLSPEACEDRPYNNKSDIWALGCILYELCSLCHPFEAKNQAALLLKIIKGKYQSIPRFYSRHMAELVHSCLMKDYKKRPSIEAILLMEVVQAKAQLLKIPLPVKKKDKPEKQGEEQRTSLAPQSRLSQSCLDKSIKEEKPAPKQLDRTSFGMKTKRPSIVSKVNEQDLKQRLLQKKREIGEKYSSPQKTQKEPQKGCASRQSRNSSNFSSSHSRSENKSMSKDPLASQAVRHAS